MSQLTHKIIFEGPELAGKSYLMSQLYNYLEPKYNSGGKFLDGCHWFNLDVGLYGRAEAAVLLDKFIDIMEGLSDRNILVEKFHLSQATYQQMTGQKNFDFKTWEDRLKKIGAKIILVTFKEDEELLAKRLDDRLKLYPHYARIAKQPQDYIRQQQIMLALAEQSQLPVYKVDASILPNPALIEDILNFLGEK